MNDEVECSRCGTICKVDGDFPKYFAWCAGCGDYAGGFDTSEYAADVMADIADRRPDA